MARYAYDKFVRLDNGLTIDREELKIYLARPLTALSFHRNLQDLFDQPDWIFHTNPTDRVTDDHIRMLPPWTMGNPDYISSGKLEHVHYVATEVDTFRVEDLERFRERKSWMRALLVFVSKQFKRFRS